MLFTTEPALQPLSYIYFSETGSLISLELTKQAGQGSTGSTGLHLPFFGDYKYKPLCLFLFYFFFFLGCDFFKKKFYIPISVSPSLLSSSSLPHAWLF